MPYEKGGRSDKQGNRYELKWCVYQLLKVLEEKLDYITIEPIGDDEDGVDLWIGYKNGVKEGQQCKGRNGANESWSYGALNSKEILRKWKTQLDRGDSIHVSLVSPLAFTYMEDLTNRAKNSGDDASLFYEMQIKSTDPKFAKFVNSFCRALGFECEDPSQAIRIINYLCRISYHQTMDSGLTETIMDKIGLLFQGDERAIYDTFITWIVDGDILGKRIGIVQIHSFLETKNLKLRNLASDPRVYPQIQELNTEYKADFRPLNTGVIRRKETDVCIRNILEGNSVIIHGAAGSGKSGLTENVIKFCEDKEIPYLAIKLDKRIPRQNVEQWSEYIGLPSSLVHCMDSISKDSAAVIILDQLDALRWTLPHSSEALSVCSGLIRQVKHINFEREKNISIIFICRTFDFDNDNNIKVLFDDAAEGRINWQKVEVGGLSDDAVKAIVGSTYDTLTEKLMKLLKLPSNLYIWQQLDKHEDDFECISTYHLITRWWKQLGRESVLHGLKDTDLSHAKQKMVEAFEKSGRLFAISEELGINSSTIDFLVSSGAIVKQDIATLSKVSFVHQSLYDCFVAEKMLIRYIQGTSVVDIIGNKQNQTPAKRYQVQMFLQSVYEYSENEFLRVGMQMLEAPEMRFSFKFVFFELLHQIVEPSDQVINIVLELANNVNLEAHVLANVIQGNPKFIGALRENGVLDEWLESGKAGNVVSLFQSIRGKLSHVDIKFIEKHVFYSQDNISQWMRCFPFDASEDSDEVFDLRMKIYRNYPDQMDVYLDLKSLFKRFEMRAVDILVLMYETKSKKNNRLLNHEEEFLQSDSEFLIQNGLRVLGVLLPLVPVGSDYTVKYSDWTSRSMHNTGIERTIMEIVKKASTAMIDQDPELFWTRYNEFMGKGHTLYNELILEGLKQMPTKYSGRIFSYLIENIESNMFTEGRHDELSYAREVIKKHLGSCDSSTWSQFLYAVIKYCPSDAVSRYKQRIQVNKENDGYLVYWSFWGDFQHEILGAIPDEYLNDEALCLKRVLERKFKGARSRYRNHIGHGGSVHSPVDGKELSDGGWIKVLTSKKLATRTGRGHWKEVNGGFIESSLEQFSSSFSSVASIEPLRMVSLILSTHEKVHESYVDALYSGISMSDQLSMIPSSMLEELLVRYPPTMDSYRASSICRIFSKHDEKRWSENVMNTIRDIAVNHKNPEIGKPCVTSEKDKEMKSSEMLQSNSLNCVRGEAARAIGDLLWKNYDLFNKFKDTILALAHDENAAVQHASLYALWPSYNIDKDWAMQNIIQLYRRDFRNVVFHNSIGMLFRLYETYREDVLEIIMRCFNSEEDKLVEIGSYAMTEMYLRKEEFKEIFDNISALSENQSKAILYMTVLYFEIDEFVDQAKEIILEFDEYDYDLEWPITRLLYDNHINMGRDKTFLRQVLKSRFSRKIAYAFNQYIEKSAEPIGYFSDLIFELSYSIIDNSGSYMDGWSAEDEISKLVIGLYDETCGLTDPQKIDIASECLDIWDLMFERQIGSARKLSFELMQR